MYIYPDSSIFHSWRRKSAQSRCIMLYIFSTRAIFQRYGLIQHTQHSLYSHNTFIPQMSPFSEWSRSNFPQYKLHTICFNLNHWLRRFLTMRFHSFLSFNHSFAFWMANPVAFKQLYYVFHRLMGGFPFRAPRPTCDCISGPRRIPAVGITRHRHCAHCRMWVYPYQGDALYYVKVNLLCNYYK